MIKKIILKNFKSYVEADLPLSPLTVLIGANASGKSNAIEGMRLLSFLAQGQKLSVLQHVSKDDKIIRGRLEAIGHNGSESFALGCRTDAKWNDLEIELTWRKDGLHITSEKVSSQDDSIPLYRIDYPSTGMGSDAKVAYNNFSQGRNKPHITVSDQFAIFTQLESPATFDARHKESQKVIPSIVKAYQEWLSNILFLDPVPVKMRDYSYVSDFRLLGDGTNLSSILYHLWRESENPFADDSEVTPNRSAILNFVQSLPEQRISKLAFLHTPRDEVMVQLTETFGGQERAYDASMLSDGTLRVLAIAAAMLSAPEGSLVVIEEIDNGVHPSRAGHLLTQIREIAEKRQLRVLISTHNPALLDALPEEAIPDVVFCYRDIQDGSSRLVRLESVPDYPELVAQGSLGHLMTSGMLDRFVKNYPGADEKKKQKLAWLAKTMGRGAEDQ